MLTKFYLDHAAATPLDPQVREAMLPYLENEFYNPSSLYEAARQTRLVVEAARADVAKVLGAKKSEIIFTAGATESVNLALFGVLRSVIPTEVEGSIQGKMSRQARHDKPIKMVTTSIEHEAVLACLPALEQEGFKAEVVAVKSNGIIDVAKIEKAINDDTTLVSVMYVNNEIGTIQPLAEIGKLIAEVRADRLSRSVNMPIYFHSDATQAPNYLDLHVQRLGVDLMTLNGSKIYGPKQTGCLYVRTGVKLEPLVYGGGQEKGLRSGTENVAGVIGFAEALKIAQQMREAEASRLTELRNQLSNNLKASIPDIALNGDNEKRIANNLNITIPGIDGEAAVLHLDREGFQVSTGSACTTGNTDPSHVLMAISCSEAEANASLRITLGRATSAAELVRFATALPTVIKRLRELRVK